MNLQSKKLSEKNSLLNTHFFPIQSILNTPEDLRFEDDCAKLPKDKLDEVLIYGSKGVEYQPIIRADSLEIFGYESLARFFDLSIQAIPPDLVFAALHHFPSELFEQELMQKQAQIRNAPMGKTLFVNLDQDSFLAFQGEPQENPLLNLFCMYKEKLVVELTENCEIVDAMGSEKVISILNKNGVSTAIDDIFKPNSLFSYELIPLIDFLKIDKFVVSHSAIEDQDFFCYVTDVIQNAHRLGKKVILEGVETLNDYTFARELGVDFVQGLYFKDCYMNYLFDYDN